MGWSDIVVENVEQVEDKDPLVYLKNAYKYCKDYEKYKFQNDYDQLNNYIKKAIDFSDSKMKEELVNIKNLIVNKYFKEAINKLNILIRQYAKDIIKFPDQNLESLIREVINLPEGDILLSDVENITNLDAKNKKIFCLEGISYLTNLKYLDLNSNSIIDQGAAKQLRDLGNIGVIDTLKMSFATPFLKPELNELSQLSKLERLKLSGNYIKDISFLEGLENLTELDLGFCYFIDDISPLSSLSKLEELNLTFNMIESIEALGNMQKLRKLYLSNNKLRTIDVLGRILSLEDLDLSNLNTTRNKITCFNSVKDIQSLIALPNLRYLDIDNNPVRKVKTLSKSKSLQSVRFNGKNIENLDELGGFYLDFRRFYTKPMGCLIAMLMIILLFRYTINLYSDGYPLGGLPVFSMTFPFSIFMLWEGYRVDDTYNKARGWVFLGISFLFLILGNGYE